MTVSYPRMAARTLRFTLGIPRNITVSADGKKVYFIRTPDGVSRTGCLWEFDVDSAQESLLVDPTELLGDDGEQLSAQERSRRERSRESAAGIVSYALDRDAHIAAFALSGRLWTVDLHTRSATALTEAASGAVIDPRPDPSGRLIAYAADRSLRVIGSDGSNDHEVVGPDTPTQTWGQAEFIAAEEMYRYRGFWWSPDGASLLVERFDEAPMGTWHIADPANPDREPVTQRYPAAGTANADVTLWHITVGGETLGGESTDGVQAEAVRTEVVWDRERFEYLMDVSWNSHGAPVIQVLSRDQRQSQVLGVDVASGSTSVLRDLADDDWIEVTSTARFAPGGQLITLEDVDGARQVVVDGQPCGEVSWNVRGIVAVDDQGVIVTASKEPSQVQVLRFGLNRTDGPAVDELTSGPFVHSAVAAAGTTVISCSAFDATCPEITVRRDGRTVGELRVLSEDPGFVPEVTMLVGGEDALRIAVLFPRDRGRESGPLPVLMDPYGGPHAQRVLASGRMFLESQWLADQGFCVVVADGRGTPGRGPAWERSVRDEFASVTLDDQVAALDAVAAAFPDDVDTSRVAMTGWSYGGYLSALAVLERPDVFHVAVAGAPVTEWRLYDTCYTERYLGDPHAQPDVYDRNSLLPRAAKLERPLMLIHGLADDNVVAAHTLRLSSALLAAGKAHTVLPLSGVTHMASDEQVAENLALLRVAYLLANLPAPKTR